jgi:hypothetical protein
MSTYEGEHTIFGLLWLTVFEVLVYDQLALLFWAFGGRHIMVAAGSKSKPFTSWPEASKRTNKVTEPGFHDPVKAPH